MITVLKKYNKLCKKRSDIKQHLPTLYKYATECESILELGVRGVVSTWAFVHGLDNNNKSTKKIIVNDIIECNIDTLLKASKDTKVNIESIWKNDLDIELKENVDMTFIDTLHAYGQLKRELDKFSKLTNKYIIMHDTTVDGKYSQIVRKHSYNFDKSKKYAEDISKSVGIPAEELIMGLWPAIEEFLNENHNWVLFQRYHNNNGLTILKRVE